MLLPKILLRQRYLLSFFATAFLIALTTLPSLAFNIIPPPQQDFLMSETYDLPNGRRGITTLLFTDFKGLARGATPKQEAALRKKFPAWILKSAPKDLAGNFEVITYRATGKPDMVGATIVLSYKPGEGDPTPKSNTLKWIERVVPNNVDGKEEDYVNTEEDYIEGNVEERSFLGVSLREDTNKPHKWLAELYLAEETEPNQITIYNGIQWGWENKVIQQPLKH
jgi:hypothetical protein